MKTQRLSLFGLAAGPFYLALGLGHALLRPGFDLAHQPLSLLSVGEWGWVQITNFMVTGVLVLLTARGWSAGLAGGKGRSVPWLLGLYGVALILSGIFVADPANATSSLLHFACGAAGFFALAAACVVMAIRFFAQGSRGRGLFSWATAILFLASFFALAAGGGASWTLLGFWLGLGLTWVWIAVVSLRLGSVRV